MQHAKFQDHRPFGSGEDFERFLPSWSCAWTIYINFLSPFPKGLHMKFGFDWPSSFREEDV